MLADRAQPATGRQWEYRVFEKAIVVLIIVGFYRCLRVCFSGPFAVTKTNFGPIIGLLNTIVGISAVNCLNALERVEPAPVKANGFFCIVR